MNYIVLDLEWNQALSSNSSVFYHLPIHLRGEIIQIGAVRLNPDFTPGEEFQIDVRPVFFRKIHYKVSKLTGIDAERLKSAPEFPEAFRKFREWCGEDCVFITWGYDDKGIMEQNIICHDEDWDWIADWINLQLIYNVQEGGDTSQKALHAAMEHFEIEQTRVAHDALGDAYNTALVCTHLNMEEGLAIYPEAPHILQERALAAARAEAEAKGETFNEPLEQKTFEGYPSKVEAMADGKVMRLNCPECGATLKISRWFSQGDNRYITIGSCTKHGKYFSRLRFRHDELDRCYAVRILYAATPELEAVYQARVTKSRKKKTVRHKKKGKSAEEA